MEVNLTLREAEPAGPIEIVFLDEHGQPVPKWKGTQYSTRSGLALDHFSEKGSIFLSCLGDVHDSLRWLAGTYRLRLKPSHDGYVMPVEAEIVVRADASNRFTLQSTGVGGRLFLRSLVEKPERRIHPTIVLTHLESDRRPEACSLYRCGGRTGLLWAPTPGASFGDDSRLLEPGEWNWVLSESGVERDSGTVRIEAERKSELLVDLGDWPDPHPTNDRESPEDGSRSPRPRHVDASPDSPHVLLRNRSAPADRSRSSSPPHRDRRDRGTRPGSSGGRRRSPRPW